MYLLLIAMPSTLQTWETAGLMQLHGTLMHNVVQRGHQHLRFCINMWCYHRQLTSS